ncbi:MAG TPA: ABC transporter permease [Candidatus Binatia bacterium]|nr:ABC transporter permease [Candidatus Binatia bacterium]
MTNATIDVTLTVAADESDDRVRAKRVAADRARKRRLQSLGIQLISLIVVLTGWQIIGEHTNAALFTTPIAVVKAARDMIGSGELWRYLAPSLIVFSAGLAISIVAGILAGLLLARFWVVDVALGPYITFLYSTPAVALVPLIVLWTGYEFTAKTIIMVLFAFFPIAINTYQGVKNVDVNLLEVGRAFRCSERQLWVNIVLPAALPFIIAGLRLAVGRGLIGMVLADLYTAISGIGYLIVRSASTYQVDRMFVPIVTLGLLGVTMTALVSFLERRLVPWTAVNKD